MTQNMNTNGIDPTAAVTPITLPLTPVEFGVVVALTGIGISAMTNNVQMAKQYQAILDTDAAEGVAYSAFEKMLAALTAQTEGA